MHQRTRPGLPLGVLAWIYLMGLAAIASLLLLLLGTDDRLGAPLALGVGAVLVGAGILAVGQLVQTRARLVYSRDLLARRYRR